MALTWPLLQTELWAIVTIKQVFFPSNLLIFLCVIFSLSNSFFEVFAIVAFRGFLFFYFFSIFNIVVGVSCCVLVLGFFFHL
jgi:hypothetical protein